MNGRISAAVTLALLLFSSTSAFAQDDDDSFLSGESKKAAPSKASEKGEDASAQSSSFHEATNDDNAFLSDSEESEIAAPEEDKSVGRAEDPDTPIFSVGARFRWIMVPRWLVEQFGTDIKSKPDSHFLVNSFGAGPEFTFRKNNFDITASIWLAGLGWDGNVSFKSSGDGGNSWEAVRNELKSIIISADFIWSTPLTDWFAITYGLGLGLGIPLGDGIHRTEASWSSEGYKPCTPEQKPPASSPDAWCGSGDDEQYNEVYEIPTRIIPWFNVLAGMRFKPHHHFAVYVDTGIGLGFQAGARAGYIF